jgi:hypothetical protein
LQPNSNEDKKILKYNYFIDCQKKKKILPMEDYYIKHAEIINLDQINDLNLESTLPLRGYKIFLHQNSLMDDDQLDINSDNNKPNEIKNSILMCLVNLLGGTIVNNIRMSDICIINKIENTQFLPPHVRSLNQDFIIDSLTCLRLPDLNLIKYKPKDRKYRKNRK